MESGYLDDKDIRNAYVKAIQMAMHTWTNDMSSQIEALEAVGVETKRVANIVDWSFQTELDRICWEFIGKKKIKPRPTPGLDEAMHILDDHRRSCERILKQTMSRMC